MAGTFSADQKAAILDCLSDGEYFIPKQIGFPEVRFEEITEDDHCWFELCENDFEETKAEPTVEMTPEEIVGKFMEAKENWDDTEKYGRA